MPVSWSARMVLCGCVSLEALVTGAVGTGIVVLTMLLSIWLNNVSFVFDLIGSTATAAVCLIIPAVIYIRIRTNPSAFVNPNRRAVLEEDDDPVQRFLPTATNDEFDEARYLLNTQQIDYASSSDMSCDSRDGENKTEPRKTDEEYAAELDALLQPKRFSDPPIVGACLLMWAGIVFGLVALAAAIIYDTDIHETYHIK